MSNRFAHLLRKIRLHPWLSLEKPRNTSLVNERQEDLKTKNNYIEIVGPPGIGKSTLLSQIKHWTKGDWHYREHLTGLKLPPEINHQQDLLHWNLLYSKVKHIHLDNSLTGYQKAKLNKYFSEVILHDLAICHAIIQKGFFLDEGLCHNFSSELTEISENDFKSLMNGRAIILLTTRDSMTVVKRIRKRELESKKNVPYHYRMNDEQLKTFTEKSGILLNTLANKAESIGVPVLRIFAEDNRQININHILEFEHQIVNT